jgi:hypothetical protein
MNVYVKKTKEISDSKPNHALQGLQKTRTSQTQKQQMKGNNKIRAEINEMENKKKHTKTP